MNLRIFGLVLILVGGFSIYAKAITLVDFNFTITGDISDTDFNPNYTLLSGNVTGEIIGLPFNGTGSASDILITSAPAGLGISPTISSPYSFSANSWDLSPTFTVTNGTITSGAYFDYNNYTHELELDGGGSVNFFGSSSDGGYTGSLVGNHDGSSGANFSSASVPEPSQYGAFLFLAVAGLIAWRRFSGTTTSPKLQAQRIR
jgi:hypothetical protein